MAITASAADFVPHVRRWPRRVVITVATIVVVVLAIRLALPYFVRSQINARLKDIPGYRGSVDDVSLQLIRGAYALNGVSIYKLNGEQGEPFFRARQIDFSIAWRELFRGKLVSDIVIEQGELTMVKGPTPETTQRDADSRWRDVVKDIFPIDIQHLEIRQGMLRYMDDTRTPPVDVYVKNMQVLATGLRNRPSETREEFPARIQVDGDSLGGGRLSILIQAEPLAASPHFHLSLKLHRVNLPALNESMKAIANVEVGQGTFDLIIEMAGKDGAFQGYVKPFFNDLDFRNVEDKHDSIGERLWEKIVAGLAWLVKNKDRDQVATRVPFQGEFGDPQVGLWVTVRNLFRHGFVRAFNPIVEGSVDPDKVPPPEQIAPKKAGRAERKAAERQLEQASDAKDAELTGKPAAPGK